VTSGHLESVEDVLLLIGRASQGARETAEQLAADGAQTALVRALAAADRELSAAQAALMRSAYFSREEAA
jgi:NAD(P)-dependent dehydrogenase (short-subunit alcohol dehydrogenase family)